MGCNQRRTGVAVIAVHGVADQKAGDTARAIADLLVAAPPGTVRYEGCCAQALSLRVQTLAPSPATPAAEHQRDNQPPTPSASGPLKKKLAQSFASDLQRSEWVVTPDPKRLRSEPSQPSKDAGEELSDFLLFKAARNGTPESAYDTERLALSRSEGGRTQPVDVYEMYWADLSRLASGVPRILTELFTLLFRLSQLGRDAVGLAARQFGDPSWRRLATLQGALDWAFAKGLALLTLQLLMAALIIVPAGLVADQPAFAEPARRALSFALPLLGALWLLYRLAGTSIAGVVLRLAALALLCVALARPPAHVVVGVAWLALLSLGYDWAMRVCERRFPMTRLAGWVMWGAVLAIVLWSAALPLPADSGMQAEQGLRIWIFGALRAVELVLVAIVVWWVVVGLLLLGWLLLGRSCARRHGFEGSATVATGRLGLFVSISLFLVLTMAAWAAVSGVLEHSLSDVSYLPLVFERGSEAIAADGFLDRRYQESTDTFSLVVVFLGLLASYLVVGFFPSVMAEMKVGQTEPSRLGRWLSVVYRWLDRLLALITVLSVLATVLVGAALLAHRLGSDHALGGFFAALSRLSTQLLTPLVVTAASTTVALTALGGLLSRYVPWLRAPLDMALDVDNHFREFPRRGIPRARIFSRFAALLAHVASQGYERIVIVGHSQGTVISTELLRYLRWRAQAAYQRGTYERDDAAQLWQSLGDRVHLLTAGCPLRQMYAARFPVLYRWVLDDREPGRLGPRAHGLGVQRWVNAYTTGDYVGRWLWTRPVEAGDIAAPMIDERQAPGDVYADDEHVPDLTQAMGGRAELDVGLGAGAHTHYFETDQHRVAGLIDQLIAGPWPLAQHAEDPLDKKAA